MSTDRLNQADQLKAQLDRLRPLLPDVVAELGQRYLVSFTYNSNAIEGNTLSQSETEMVLEQGITVGGRHWLSIWRWLGTETQSSLLGNWRKLQR